MGLFAYYSQWLPRFSDKAYSLVHNKTFPLPPDVLQTFQALKQELENAAVVVVEPGTPLVVETDASEVAIAATLSQNGKPVAFFSRTLSPTERRHPAIEKEACAIIEAIRKWRHYLIGNHFKLITDQRSVAFMYDQHSSKIKKDKILRWRLELSSFRYDVVYRPGALNLAADALSRSHCASIHDQHDQQLKNLHDSLCHPGITRLTHFVRTKNLPYSIADVKSVTNQCRACAEVKPRFFNPPHTNLIKATQPFERLSIDFKGPLPSKSSHRYLLTCIDEYSRFPFAFACSDVTSSTVIKCLIQLFALFGMPAYIHSDRGACFVSEELRKFLHEKGISTSRTTSYSPQGNGQVERLNGTLWRTIQLALKSRNLPITHWEDVLLDALHSVRSLLCTATNCTPHERLFTYCRKSTAGTSLPTWLTSSGPVLLKRHDRSSKYDPIAEEVELLECNPKYAVVRMPGGKEDTVSVRHLAPLPAHQHTYPLDSMIDSDRDETKQTTTEMFDASSESDSQSRPRNTKNAEVLLLQQQRTRPYILRNREA